MFEKIRDRLVDDIGCMLRWWTTWLNVIGTAIVTYALSLTPVVNALLPFLPDKLKPYAPLLGAAWGLLVQALRSIKQAPKAPANG
jgi:hypothetical protein